MTDLTLSSHDELQDLDLSAPASGLQEDGAPLSRTVIVPLALTTPPTFGFDYSGVSAAVAREAEATAERIRNRHRAGIIDTGGDLLAIKDKLDHGKFGNWLSYHFGMSERTAQNYMNAAIAFSSVPKVIDVLPPSTIYKLAAKGAPEKIRQSVIDEITNGAVLDHKEIETRIATAKSEERQKQEEERTARQEEREWQKQEQALREAGKSEKEIESERKQWVTKKARKERHAQQKASDTKKHEEEALVRGEQMRQTAATAAKILKARLGGDYEKLRDAILKINYHDFQTALLNA